MSKVIGQVTFKDYSHDFGLEIRRARKLQLFSQERLADVTGLHYNTIGAVERGKEDLSLVSVARILAALGCENFDVNETSFDMHLQEISAYPVIDDVLKLPANIIVSMTGTMIHSERSKLGLSLEELATLSGIHKNSLWNLEQGLVNPSVYHLFCIHKALRVKTLQGCSSGLHVIEKI